MMEVVVRAAKLLGVEAEVLLRSFKSVAILSQKDNGTVVLLNVDQYAAKKWPYSVMEFYQW